MRKVDSNHNSTERLTRRRYAQILAGASTAGLAGCFGSDDSNGGDDDDGNGGNGGGNGDPTGDPQRESIRVWVENVPAQANLNPWAATDRTQGSLFLTELTAPNYIPTSETLLDGHTWEADWMDDVDEISIPTVFTDYEVEPPYDVYEHLNPELTYWDGTDINAEAFVLEEQMFYFTDDHHLNPEATMNAAAEEEYVFHWWEDKGEVEGQEPNPRNEVILENDAAGSHEMPPHPDFTRPYVERYEDVDTADDTDEIHEDLESHRITFQEFADNGWGSGLYELDSSTIDQMSMSAFARDDHPNEHWTIPELEMQFAESDRWSVLARQGTIDIGEDIVQSEDGVINRVMLPDHMQEIDRYIMGNGDHWAMNWNNPHLGRLWVRRAIIAAIDWHQFGRNGWGADGSIPNEYHVCLPDMVSNTEFDDEFLDELYQYPIEQDLDLAAEWLENAGYTGSISDGWEGPEGRELELTIDVNGSIPDWTGAYDTAQENLQSAGFQTEQDPLDGPSWQGRMGQDVIAQPNYTMGLMWGDEPLIWEWYNINGDWWTYPLVGGDPESEWAGDADPEDLDSDVDNHGRPFSQQVPTEPGTFDAPNEAGVSPDVPNGEEVNLAVLADSLRDADTTEEEFTENAKTLARYANYYVPFFTFHTFPHGYWGNVRDFTFPPEGHPANRTHKEFNNEDYTPLAGIAQLKYDDSYPDP